MIAWIIGIAQKSQLYDRIIVSTDDAEISNIAQQYGAEVPRLRAEGFADDVTSVMDVVVKDIIDFNIEDNIVCMLYATAAGLLASDLVDAYEKFCSAVDADYSMGVTEFAHPVQRRVNFNNEFIEMSDPNFSMVRTQDLEPYYHDAGQFIFGYKTSWLQKKSVWSAKTTGYILPSHRAIDIDTEDDWKRAEVSLGNILSNV